MAVAFARMRFGNISDISTHTTGPSEIANAATYTKIKISTIGPDVFPLWKASPITAKLIVMIEDPISSKTLRPTLSMSQMARIVNKKLISPTRMVWINAASVPAPVSLNISGAYYITALIPVTC